MAIDTNCSTELSAVNTILIAAGEMPTNSLTTSGIQNVTIARTILNNVSREIQTHGWSFNLEKNYVLSLGTDGSVPISPDILGVMPTDNSMDFTIIGNQLYDNTNHSFNDFATSVTANVIFFRPFDRLPQHAKNYITIKAARQYQVATKGSETLFQMTKDDEDDARRDFMRTENRTRKTNLLRNANVQTILGG